MSEIEQTPLAPPQMPSGKYRLMGWVSSFFDISLQTANRFYTLGWGLSFTGALITFVGVILLMWGTRVRDQDFEGSMAKLHERAAASEVLSAELKKGNLNLQIDLERERSSRLELEAKLAPRRLTEKQFQILSHDLQGISFPISLITIASDSEAKQFALDIKKALLAAGLDFKSGVTVLIAGGGIITGVRISGPKEMIERVGNAFVKAGIIANGVVRDGEVEILVASKPMEQ